MQRQASTEISIAPRRACFSKLVLNKKWVPVLINSTTNKKKMAGIADKFRKKDLPFYVIR